MGTAFSKAPRLVQSKLVQLSISTNVLLSDKSVCQPTEKVPLNALANARGLSQNRTCNVSTGMSNCGIAMEAPVPPVNISVFDERPNME